MATESSLENRIESISKLIEKHVTTSKDLFVILQVLMQQLKTKIDPAVVCDVPQRGDPPQRDQATRSQPIEETLALMIDQLQSSQDFERRISDKMYMFNIYAGTN